MQSIDSKINEIKEFLDKNISKDDMGLYSGFSGQYLFKYFYEKEIMQLSTSEIFDQYIGSLEDFLQGYQHYLPTFCGGLAGVGWFMHFFHEKEKTDMDLDILLEDFDEYLENTLNYYLSVNNWDFLHGATGLMFYFIKRGEKFKNTLNKCLDFFIRTAIRDDNAGTIKWENGFHGGEDLPKITFNIAMSHGMSSLLMVLSKLYQSQILENRKTEIKDLIKGGIKYILCQEMDPEKVGCFFPGTSLEEENQEQMSRLGWCYGDLGVAIVLYQIGQIFEEKDWIDKGIEVLVYNALNRRDVQLNMVTDAGFCHGAVGIAHIFYRMWWNTNMQEFKYAAEYWFQVTLQMAYHKDGLAGYKTWYVPDLGGWANRANLLEGIAGIGLSMLTFDKKIEPVWDECFLLS